LGTYSTTLTANSSLFCVDCGIGKYSSTRASSSVSNCLECPTGKHSVISRAPSLNTCISCEAGEFMENRHHVSNECVLCPRGSWNGNLNTVGKCTNCSAGKYSSSVGATDEKQCIQRPRSTFNPDVGSRDITHCRPCLDNTKTPNRGFVSQNECLLFNITDRDSQFLIPSDEHGCDPGYYFKALLCIPCPAGTYNSLQTHRGIESCILCRSGKFNPYQERTSVKDCQSCPDGKFHHSRGVTDQIHCKVCVYS